MRSCYYCNTAFVNHGTIVLPTGMVEKNFVKTFLYWKNLSQISQITIV